MKLTVSLPDESVIPIDISADILISELRMLISVECGLPESQLILLKDGVVISSNLQNTVNSMGIRDNDLIVVIPIPRTPSISQSSSASLSTHPTSTQQTAGVPRLNFSSIRVPNQSNTSHIESARQTLLNGTPSQLSLLRDRNPELADVLHDPEQFARVFREQQARVIQHRQELETLMTDPLNPAAQQRIADLIRQQNIDMQMESALEHYPETFAQVTMLFINCKVKDQPIKAFVDSGAQSTLMSEACAARCNLDSLIDKRWAGRAYGVGTQAIVGRIHHGLIEVQGTFIPTSFIVLKDQSMDLLIGLDMLKRHQCCIDLKRNVLVFDGKIEAPFLPESEIPITAAHPELLDLEMTEQGPTSSTNFSESQKTKIQQLIDQGASRPQAIEQLLRHKWDIDAALAAYLASLDSMPNN